MDLLSEQIITINEYINSRDINNDINKVLYNKIKDGYGNKCHELGYILKESIELIQRSIGTIQTINNQSIVSYIIKFKCKIININNDDKIDVIINTAAVSIFTKYDKRTNSELDKTIDTNIKGLLNIINTYVYFHIFMFI